MLKWCAFEFEVVLCGLKITVSTGFLRLWHLVGMS